MAYVICEPCVGVKDKACIPVCPCDCIHEGDKMLYINPAECIDCDACRVVCPVQAIYVEEDVPEPWKGYVEENAKFYESGKGCLCHPA